MLHMLFITGWEKILWDCNATQTQIKKDQIQNQYSESEHEYDECQKKQYT